MSEYNIYYNDYYQLYVFTVFKINIYVSIENSILINHLI